MPTTRSLTRPVDGKCSGCRAPLPEEINRSALTHATDVCHRCATTRRAIALSSPAGKEYLDAWKSRLWDLERDSFEE
jgi:hypothetical protein